MSSPVRLLVAALATLLLSGCNSLSAILQGRGSPDAPVTIEPTPAQLSELERLGTGTYQEKVDLFANIEAARIANPTDTNRLRYALAKSIHDHPSTDLPGAFSELQALLGAHNDLSLSQTQLATIVFRNTEQMIILATESDSLRLDVASLESSNTARSSKQGARLQESQSRLASAEQENLRLQQELGEARRQLDAILSIETSSDRDN